MSVEFGNPEGYTRILIGCIRNYAAQIEDKIFGKGRDSIEPKINYPSISHHEYEEGEKNGAFSPDFENSGDDDGRDEHLNPYHP
jgi:hypothetical protein